MRELAQLRGRASRRSRRRLEGHAEIGRGLLQNRQRRRLRGDVERAVTHRPVPQPRDVFIGRDETVDDDEAVGRLVAEVVAHRRAALRGLHRASRCLREVGQRLERPVEAVEDAIELHAHLKRERVSGVVVRRRRRRARVRDVVRVILRLEHVHHVRTERLRRLYDERVRGYCLPATVKDAVARCTVMPDLMSALTNRTAVPKSG